MGGEKMEDEYEEYTFGKGSVFQILDDMAALRETRKCADSQYDVYKEERYSSPEMHYEVCTTGEGSDNVYVNNKATIYADTDVYDEESYSSPEKHYKVCTEVSENVYKNSEKETSKANYRVESYSLPRCSTLCMEKENMAFDKRKYYLKSNSSVEYIKEKKIDFTQEKEKYRNSGNKHICYEKAGNVDKKKSNIGFVFLVLISFFSPVLGILCGVIMNIASPKERKGNVFIILSFIFIILQFILISFL